MARAFRIDRHEARRPQKRADGSVRYDAVLARTGVLTYVLPDGSLRREYRPPEEVGHKDSLASLELAHVVDDHPAKRGEAKAKNVGQVGDALRFDGKLVHGAVVVRDDVANAKIDAGKSQLSPGYDVDLDETPGTSPDGERYDAVQRNIRYEHVAIVTAGRQGARVALHKDSADIGHRLDAAIELCGTSTVALCIQSPSLSSDALDRLVKDRLREEHALDKLTVDRADATTVQVTTSPWGMARAYVNSRELSLDELAEKVTAALKGADVTVSRVTRDDASEAPVPTAPEGAPMTPEQIKALQDELAQTKAALAEAQKKLADIETAKKTVEDEKANLAGQNDTLKDRVDALEKARTDVSPAAIGQIRARLKLEETADKVLGTDFKKDGADDTSIKVAVFEKLTGKKLDPELAKNPHYVAGRYDTALEGADLSAGALAAARAAGASGGERDDKANETEADAAKRMRERNAALSQNNKPGGN